MRRPLAVPSASIAAVAALALWSPAAAAPPLPPGCVASTVVTFGDGSTSIAPGTYSQPGPPATTVTFGPLAGATVSFEVTTPGWRILAADVGYVYDDVEGGPLGQSESHTYGTGVISSSVTLMLANGPLIEWSSAVFQVADCGTPATTAAPTTTTTTTVAPTTLAPTTLAPTTVAPTTVAPTTATPGAAAPAAPRALPSTGGKADVAGLAVAALVLGSALLVAARRRVT